MQIKSPKIGILLVWVCVSMLILALPANAQMRYPAHSQVQYPQQVQQVAMSNHHTANHITNNNPTRAATYASGYSGAGTPYSMPSMAGVGSSVQQSAGIGPRMDYRNTYPHITDIGQQYGYQRPTAPQQQYIYQQQQPTYSTETSINNYNLVQRNSSLGGNQPYRRRPRVMAPGSYDANTYARDPNGPPPDVNPQLYKVLNTGKANNKYINEAQKQYGGRANWFNKVLHLPTRQYSGDKAEDSYRAPRFPWR